MKTEDLILEIVKGLKDGLLEVKNDIKDLKTDMNRRFEQVDKRFEQIDKRFEQVDKRFDRLEDDVRADKDKLQDVYESREKVKITFGWQWGMVSLFIAITAGAIVKIFA